EGEAVPLRIVVAPGEEFGGDTADDFQSVDGAAGEADPVGPAEVAGDAGGTAADVDSHQRPGREVEDGTAGGALVVFGDADLHGGEVEFKERSFERGTGNEVAAVVCAPRHGGDSFRVRGSGLGAVGASPPMVAGSDPVVSPSRVCFGARLLRRGARRTCGVRCGRESGTGTASGRGGDPTRRVRGAGRERLGGAGRATDAREPHKHKTPPGR